MSKLTSEDIEKFRTHMKETHGLEMTSVEAEGRYLELLNLIWLFCHRPPGADDPPYTPPLPPWL